MINYGVIIARFQVPELHLGHMYLINEVKKNHSKVLVLLGVPDTRETDINPLSYEIREKMVKQHFPEITILPLQDIPDDVLWSNSIDSILSSFDGTPILYGSRKSFKPHYTGKHLVIEIQPVWERSGTDIRNELMEPIHTTNFRAGMIHSIMKRPSIVYPAVHVVCMKDNVVDEKHYSQYLMFKGSKDKFWKFPGGIVNNSAMDYESVAKTKFFSQIGQIEISNWKYKGSCKVSPIAYYNTKDSIISNVYYCEYTFGGPLSDELFVSKWVDIKDLKVHVHPEQINILPLIGAF